MYFIAHVKYNRDIAKCKAVNLVDFSEVRKQSAYQARNEIRYSRQNLAVLQHVAEYASQSKHVSCLAREGAYFGYYL